MKTKFLLISLFIGVIVLTAFITNKNSIAPEYALLVETQTLIGSNVFVVYENGKRQNLEDSLHLKITESPSFDFPEIVKAFQYLNEKGFKLQTQTSTGKDGNHREFIFIKE